MIKGVTYILKNDVTFQSIVGQNVALSKYKAYPLIAPQPESVPYSVVRMTNKELLHKGASGSNRNAFNVSFMVTSYHINYDDVDLLDQAVIQALVPYRGTANSVVFGWIEYVNSVDEYVDAYGGLYARMSNFNAQVTLAELT